MLLCLCTLVACIGPAKLFEQTFAELKQGCEEFGEEVGATKSCDMSASEAEQDCKNLLEEAEEYDCKSEAEDWIGCLLDADMSRVCSDESSGDICTSDVEEMMRCLGYY